jgi:predicted ester cyclase
MSDLIAPLQQAVDAWNQGNLPGYLRLYDDRVRLHGYAPEPMDKAALTGFYQSVYQALRADDRAGPALTIHEAVASGDTLAARFTMSGVHRAQFMGVPVTNRPYSMGGVTMMRFDAGRVVERWACADILGLLVQLGAVPPPG